MYNVCIGLMNPPSQHIIKMYIIFFITFIMKIMHVLLYALFTTVDMILFETD